MAPKSKPSPPGILSKSWKAVKGVYNDEFKWQVVKSWGLFLFGVQLARELAMIPFDGSAPPDPL